MIFDPQYPIYIHHSYVDMRKGHNTLSRVVINQMEKEPHLVLYFSSSQEVAKHVRPSSLMAMDLSLFTRKLSVEDLCLLMIFRLLLKSRK